MNGGKRVYKMESNETKQKEYTGPTVEELNRQMAQKQKSGQHQSKALFLVFGGKFKFENFKSISAVNQQSTNQKALNEPEVIDGKEKKKGFSKDDKKAIAAVFAPMLAMLSWRHPMFARIVAIPSKFI